MTLIVGLDPGSIRLGYAVIEITHGKLRHLSHGTLSASRSQPLHERLALLYSKLSGVFEEYSQMTEATTMDVSIEKVFVARNFASALTLGQARGMILLAVGQRGCGLAEYAPAEIKKAVTGSGRASKEQVATMVSRILGIRISGEKSDSTDALAAAICHAANLQTERSLAGRIGG